MAIIDEVYEEKWIKKHSLPCVSQNLDQDTTCTIILPKIESLRNDGVGKDDFIIGITETLQSHNDRLDIKEIIDCIAEAIKFVFGEKDFQISPSFLSIASYTAFGHSIFLIGKEAGYIR